MSWWNGFADCVDFDVPLGNLTWFRLGGAARYLFRPRDARELVAGVVRARQEGIDVRVLGCGANVLVSDDGFDGVVVRLDSDAFKKIDSCGEGADVGAGVDLMPFARDCSATGLSGLECMAGIPATVGGAIRMNAGGRFGEFGQTVREAQVLCEDGTVETWSRDRLRFGYRRSAVKREIVLSARLELVQDDPACVKHRFDECFEYKKRSQPMADHSAGCIFKNPDGRSAGALIDRAGLKGTICGKARVSERHANFIVTEAGATASDCLRLIDLVRDRVSRDFGIELEVEVDIW